VIILFVFEGSTTNGAGDIHILGDKGVGDAGDEGFENCGENAFAAAAEAVASILLAVGE